MRVLITICARGGSKGVPGKNIRPINGKPLIGYSIEIAQAFAKKINGLVTLSTDSLEIKKVAETFGLTTEYLRPEALATDSAGKIAVLNDVLNYEENKNKTHYNYLLDLDITSPLRTIEDLTKAYNFLKNNPEALNLFSVSPARRNPYFNMVELNSEGFAIRVKAPEKTILSRQQAPKVFDMNASFYFYRRRFFEDGYDSALTKKSLIYEVPHTCFDLDHPIDFEFMSYLIENNKLDLEL